MGTYFLAPRRLRGNSATGSAPPPMLGTVTIKGFKSIVNATVDLGRLNVFIGANGSGKSVMLEAIGVLGAAADGRVDDTALLRRGVRPGVPELYKNAFAGRTTPRVISLLARSVSSPSASYQIALDNPIGQQAATPWRFSNENVSYGDRKLITRSPRGANLWGKKPAQKQSFKPRDPARGVADTPSPFGPLPEEVTGFLEYLRGYVIYDPQTPVLRGIAPESAPVDPIGVHGGRLAEAVNELGKDPNRFGSLPVSDLRKLIDWAEQVGSSPPTPELISPSLPTAKLIVRFTDRYMKTDRNQLSAYDASEGALYILFALALVFHPRSPRMFAIENIDHALHPRLARKMVETLTEYVAAAQKQLLLTTHNPLVLDALDLSNPDVRLFTVDRNRHGHTEIRQIVHSEALQKARDAGNTLSQLWVGGLIGAVPNII